MNPAGSTEMPLPDKPLPELSVPEMPLLNFRTMGLRSRRRRRQCAATGSESHRTETCSDYSRSDAAMAIANAVA